MHDQIEIVIVNYKKIFLFYHFWQKYIRTAKENKIQQQKSKKAANQQRRKQLQVIFKHCSSQSAHLMLWKCRL